jgi:hypothetical protein
LGVNDEAVLVLLGKLSGGSSKNAFWHPNSLPPRNIDQ